MHRAGLARGVVLPTIASGNADAMEGCGRRDIAADNFWRREISLKDQLGTDRRPSAPPIQR